MHTKRMEPKRLARYPNNGEKIIWPKGLEATTQPKRVNNGPSSPGFSATNVGNSYKEENHSCSACVLSYNLVHLLHVGEDPREDDRVPQHEDEHARVYDVERPHARAPLAWRLQALEGRTRLFWGWQRWLEVLRRRPRRAHATAAGARDLSHPGVFIHGRRVLFDCSKCTAGTKKTFVVAPVLGQHVYYLLSPVRTNCSLNRDHPFSIFLSGISNPGESSYSD